MPVKPEDRMNAAREAMDMYQLQSDMADPKYGKTKALLRQGLNRNDPNSLVSQAITAAGGNPQDYTTGALIGKGIKSLSQLVKK